MSSASVFCYGCGRYWRPQHIYRVNKAKRAPDGGLSGQCHTCHRIRQNRGNRARFERLRADPERYAAYREHMRQYERTRRARMSPEQRLAAARRNEQSRDKARQAERHRLYYQQHREEILVKRRAADNARRRALRQSDPERMHERERRNRQRQKARAFAQRVAALRGGGA